MKLYAIQFPGSDEWHFHVGYSSDCLVRLVRLVRDWARMRPWVIERPRLVRFAGEAKEIEVDYDGE